MANYNKVLLMGNLTRDPQLRYLPSNLAVCEFGLAVNRRWRDRDGNQKEETCFVDCTAFGRQAETLNQYMSKGRPLFLEGRLRFESWTGQDGQKRSKLTVVAENFQFLGARGDAPAGGGGGPGGGSPAERAPGAQREPIPVEDVPPPDDDLPF